MGYTLLRSPVIAELLRVPQTESLKSELATVQLRCLEPLHLPSVDEKGWYLAPMVERTLTYRSLY